MTNDAEPRLAMFAHADLSAVLRGRSFPIRLLERHLRDGMPWVPANVTISALNTLPPDNPFGPVGETRLKADPATRVGLPRRSGGPAMDVYLADIRTVDGEPWAACPRNALKKAVADLRDRHGFVLKVGFEHEFTIRGLTDRPTPAFSLAGTRAVSSLSDEVLRTLDASAIALEQFVAEYGADQFEIAFPASEAVAAADHAVMTLEVIRDACRGRGLTASFLPKPSLAQPGNGVHIHVSLWTVDGTPATASGGWLAPASGAFAAGLLARLPSVVGFTTGSVNSYARLQPQSWVGVYSCIGERNREAALRFCPRGTAADGTHPDASIEFRVADATGNPYLALAAIIRAGMDGIDGGLPSPENMRQNPHALPEAERLTRGIARLPGSLQASLGSLVESGDAARWFGPLMAEAHAAARRNDIADAEGLDHDGLAARLSLAH